MKKIELTAFEDQKEDVEHVLSKYSLPYNKQIIKTDDKDMIYYMAVAPDDTSRKAVEPLAELLDTEQKNIFITLHDLEATYSDYLDKIEEEQKSEKITSKLTEEFHQITEPAVDFKVDLFMMVLLATSVALIGLFLNNVILIIGGMLLAPLLGPITSFSFNVAVAQPKKILRSALNGLILVASSILLSALLTFVAGNFVDLSPTEEIMLRTQVTPIFLILAVILGMAGGVATASDISGMLVGVVVAAALVPPAVVTGIGIAFADFEMFYGAFVLTSSNIIGLILGTMIVFYAKRITPKKYYKEKQAKKYYALSFALFIGMFLVMWYLVTNYITMYE